MIVVNGLTIWHLSIPVVDFWSNSPVTIVIPVSVFAECKDSLINLSHIAVKICTFAVFVNCELADGILFITVKICTFAVFVNCELAESIVLVCQ
jgi:hypothetical protein